MANGHVVLAVAFSVVVQLPLGVDHEYGCSSSNSIDQTSIGISLMLKCNLGTYSDIELASRTFPLGD